MEQSLVKQADVILLKSDNLRLINLVSAYRPSAYVFVFSKEPEKMRNLTALNYGVYVFDEK